MVSLLPQFFEKNWLLLDMFFGLVPFLVFHDEA